MNQRTKIIAASLIVIAVVALAYHGFSPTKARVLDQSSFYEVVREGRVREVTLVPDAIGFDIRGTLESNSAEDEKFASYVLADPGLLKMLSEKGMPVKVESPSDGSGRTMLIRVMLLLIFGAVFVFFMRRMQQQSGGMFSLRKSRAKLSPQTGKVTFKDVAGVEEAKQELQEVVEFLQQPDKYQKLGCKIPTGVLLIGPPGTGKTLLARAVAGEAGVPFFSVSGSDFVEMFVGIGASRVRDLFEQGRKNAPCIVFVDEIDAVGRRRGTGVGGGHDEREQTLNQLLVELDGFEGNSGVIILAATNRPDVLDPALLRPGRFDRQVVVGQPDVRGREQIIRVHARKVPLHADVQLDVIARGTSGFSGADLANLVNEAALRAAIEGRESVTRDDFEHARDKGLMGSARRSLVVNDKEKRAMAYRQAGHALLAFFLPESDPLHKVTIIPRGRDLGTTQQIPVTDRYITSRSYLLARISGLLGGRVAEELQLQQLSNGSFKEVGHITSLARRMVTEWGMSESLGPLSYGKPTGPIFIGREIAQHRDYSESTAAEIDRETKKIVMNCYQDARRILTEHADALTRVAEALLLHETLTAAQVATLIRGDALESTIELGVDPQEQQEATDRKSNVARGLSGFPEPDPRPA